MKPDWPRERVVVTGGTGFIGSFVVERLLDAGAKVRVPRRGGPGFLAGREREVEWAEGDLHDGVFCAELLRGATRLFHFASVRRNVAFHHEHAGEVLRGNVSLSTALATVVHAQPIPVLFCSSANVPPSVALPIPPQAPYDGYALGKFVCEMMWQATAAQDRFPLLILRPVGVYGPRDRFAADGNVIPALILKAQAATTRLDVWGSGRMERSFLYVEDLAAAVFALTEADVTGTEYVSPKETVTVRALATQIRDLVHPELPLHFDTSRPEGANQPPIPPSHPSLSSLAWTPLQEGLRRTLDWSRRSR